MAWKLTDLCLRCIENNMASFPDLGSLLPVMYQEKLIERLACHDHFCQDKLRHISRSLFTSALRHLYLRGCNQVTDEMLQLLSHSGCRLEVLVLSRLNNVSDIGVQAITKGQAALLVLEIELLPLITQQILTSISSPKLWSFKLIYLNKQTPVRPWYNVTTLSNFLSQNPSIKVLEMHVDTEHIPLIARGLGISLEELKTQYQTMTDESIEALARFCPSLRKLDLNGAKLVGKESLIKLFQACTQMTYLDLSYCNRLAPAPECEVMWTLPQSLTSLSLCGLMLQDKDILVEAVTRLSRLTSLKLCGVPALNDDTLTRIAENIGYQLTDLNLSQTQTATDTGLKSVATFCTMLKSLCINFLQQVTGITLLPIFTDHKRAFRIQELSISCTLMDVSILDRIMISCPNLELLELSGLSTVNDDMIINLAEHSPRLTQLDLSGCKQVTDAAICYLSGCCPLTSLCLSGLRAITDKSIFSLASSCPQLEEIFLNGCAHVSPVAVQYLKDCCLGRLHARHNIPNASPNQLMARNLDTGEFCRADLL